LLHTKTFINGPLVVDLDGTLIKTDLLWESIILAIKKKPFTLFLLPFWFLKGKSGVKIKLSKLVTPDITLLPFNRKVLEIVTTAYKEKRTVVLATASNITLAEAISKHTGCFTDVIGSTESVNLKGKNKLTAIVNKYGATFDYIGNSFADYPLWEKARQQYVAIKDDVLTGNINKITLLFKFFSSYSSPLQIAKLLRSVQWLKNLLIFIPILTSLQFLNLYLLSKSFLAFIAISLCASGTYILNDLLDIESDRAHQTKKRRLFAAGNFPIATGIALIPILLLFSFWISVKWINPHFCIALGIYTFSTLLYSFYIKKKKIADVLLLAGLYTIRLYMGGIATGIAISDWLLSFTLFLFLSLALVKRSTEILSIKTENKVGISGRGYLTFDETVVISSGISSAYISILIFILYIKDFASKSSIFSHPIFLWFVPPLILYWITRIWFLTVRGRVDADPVFFAAKDWVSWIIGVLTALLFFAAVY
jgi:4-hydroxybenzoate polyprenyltransferase